MKRISYDKQSQCWREDANGIFLGIFTKKNGWVPMYTLYTYEEREA